MQLQIGYLRAIEDSERVRAASLNYLQTWFIHFYPERVALVKQLEQLAATLGGRLEAPRLSWKYILDSKTPWLGCRQASSIILQPMQIIRLKALGLDLVFLGKNALRLTLDPYRMSLGSRVCAAACRFCGCDRSTTGSGSLDTKPPSAPNFCLHRSSGPSHAVKL
jgi:hypothetical protein